MMRAIVIVSLMGLGNALVAKPKDKEACKEVSSLSAVRTYWHSKKYPKEHSHPKAFDIVSKSQIQTGDDAGIFGTENGQVTLIQGGGKFTGCLAADCKSIKWSDGDSW